MNGLGGSPTCANERLAAWMLRRCWCGVLLLVAVAWPGWAVATEVAEGLPTSEAVREAAVRKQFEQVRPLIAAHCLDCHDADTHEGGVDLETIDAVPDAATRSVFQRVIHELHNGTMPPEEAEPLPASDREPLLAWAEDGLAAFEARPVPRNGSVRRLTVAQVRQALRDLLGIEDDVTGGMPADAISKEGFTNQAATLQLSPRQLEAAVEAAERAVDLVMIDPAEPPAIQQFRMELGTGVNPAPTDEPLILGHISRLIPAANVWITEPAVQKSFPFAPVAMQRQFRFIEGYQGNDTVRGWREFAGMEHAVFACLRGSDGDDVKDFIDPRGRGHQVVPEGLLLRPSIPSARYLGVGSKYGPLPNFKVAVRELPHRGRFRVTVRAACCDDLLVVPPGTASVVREAVPALTGAELSQETPSRWRGQVAEPGIAVVRVRLAGIEAKQPQADGQPATDSQELAVSITAAGSTRQVTARWMQPDFAVVRLPAGEVTIEPHSAGPDAIEQIQLIRLEDDHPLARRLTDMEQRRPWLGVHLGLRRDCGSTLAPVGPPQRVDSSELRDYVFAGAIANFPDPQVEAGNPNYLAGLREIAVRSEYTSERDMPRLLVKSVEFEGPLHEQWPPEPYARIVNVPGADAAEPKERAAAILAAFAERAWRRPITVEERDGLLAIWQQSHAATGSPRQALRDGLVAVLVAPQFLFLIEESSTPEPEPLGGYELASKLSFFLWNAPPDAELLSQAAAGSLQAGLAAQTDRLIDDPRFEAFAEVFASEWLRLDRFDVLEIDAERFPRLRRHVRPHLREEPARLLAHLMRRNASPRELIVSDTLVVNEAVADYYGLDTPVESGFAFVPVSHVREDLGGLLTLPAVLAGLSDGREPNPVKRGAWLARKIIARPPADPPPNVPKLEDLTQLSLRERLEQHRSARGCTGCHEGIDPWGLPFEGYAADGLAVAAAAEDNIDASSRLPDGTQVENFAAFRVYLLTEQVDRVAASFAWHLATYATGRRPSPREEQWLEQMAAEINQQGGGLRDILQRIVASEMFLTK